MRNPIFDCMISALIASAKEGLYVIEQWQLHSVFLNRVVIADIYLPQQVEDKAPLPLLLVNDGQDLPKMPFATIVNQLVSTAQISPVIAVGLYCNENRKLEYGTADEPDYLNRGSLAKFHCRFVVEELIPFLHKQFTLPAYQSISFAGFSLGGLSAMDIVWKHPEVFDTAGIFSGSFWWRSKDLGKDYNDDTDRIMHKLVRRGQYADNLSFFFQTGALDEMADRNNNGIIDSIDDTLDLMKELRLKGYGNEQLKYLELPQGKHDVATWALAFPEFLKWRYRF